MKQSPCVPLFVIIFLHVNRYGGQGKVFINIVLCPEVTGFSDENAEVSEVGCLRNSLRWEPALLKSPLWAFEIP